MSHQDLSYTQATQELKKGSIIAAPSDGRYLLLCDLQNEHACQRINVIKGRPAGRPLTVLFPSLDAVHSARVMTPLLKLAKLYWPAPLSLSVPAYPGLSATVTGSKNMVNVQVPSHIDLHTLLMDYGRPIACSSANRSGASPIQTKSELNQQFTSNEIKGVLQGQCSTTRSTLLGLVEGELHCYKEGDLTLRLLQDQWSKLRWL